MSGSRCKAGTRTVVQPGKHKHEEAQLAVDAPDPEKVDDVEVLEVRVVKVRDVERHAHDQVQERLHRKDDFASVSWRGRPAFSSTATADRGGTCARTEIPASAALTAPPFIDTTPDCPCERPIAFSAWFRGGGTCTCKEAKGGQGDERLEDGVEPRCACDEEGGRVAPVGRNMRRADVSVTAAAAVRKLRSKG